MGELDDLHTRSRTMWRMRRRVRGKSKDKSKDGGNMGRMRERSPRRRGQVAIPYFLRAITCLDNL